MRDCTSGGQIFRSEIPPSREALQKDESSRQESWRASQTLLSQLQEANVLGSVHKMRVGPAEATALLKQTQETLAGLNAGLKGLKASEK